MKYYIIGIILIIILLFLFFYPFKVTIYNKDNYLYVNISELLNLKINLNMLLNKRYNLDDSSRGIKLISKIKIKEMDINISGLNFNYNLNGMYFGILYGIFGFFDSLCDFKDINFRYDLNYSGDKSISFKSVIKARVNNVIKVFKKI